MENFILYNNFINTESHTSFRGDGGNEIYDDILKYCKNIFNTDEFFKIKNEIEVWLKIGSPSYFVMAVNLIGDLNLIEFKEELKRKRIQIIKKQIPYFPEYLIDFIDNALKRME